MNIGYWRILISIFILFFMNGCRPERSIFTRETSIPTNTLTLTISKETIIFTPAISPKETLSPKQIEMKYGIEIGNIIIGALDHFYQDYGYYPTSLLELVPVYIENIPLTSTGKEFYYVKYSEDHINGPYMLAFDCVTVHYVGCAYHTRLNEWECAYFPPE